ncbi:MAG: hypothetical protein IIW01_11320, partial [Thermoguttaceae bacterium]|nr:hypothetical protein [Thermoguttaceae bacterium]
MKCLSKTTGALLVAGCASLFGGCVPSEPQGTYLEYEPDTIEPQKNDTSDLTMKTPVETVDPQQKALADIYDASKPAPRPVAAPRPAAAPVEPALAAKEDIDAAKARIEELAGTYKTAKNGAIIEINVESADTTVEDMALFGRLFDLEKVFFLGANFNDEYLA